MATSKRPVCKTERHLRALRGSCASILMNVARDSDDWKALALILERASVLIETLEGTDAAVISAINNRM